MAVSGMVLGIVGVIFGLIPILAVPALICGALALIFGGVGFNAVRKDPRRSGKGLAIAGIALGTVSVILAVAGFIIVANAFN